MQVVEKFISINGEGLKQGELALFIRFANCNLRCSYCDTLYSFINPIYEEIDVDDLVNYAIKSKIKNVTLTGGEPLLQSDIKELIIKLVNNNFNVEVETNGSISIKDYLDINNVSFTLDYKLPTSLMEKFMNVDNYNYIDKDDSIKFVCGDINDLNKAYEIMIKYDLINKSNCLISPVFNEIDLKEIVNFLIEKKLNNVKLNLQIHKIIWDPSKRGV